MQENIKVNDCVMVLQNPYNIPMREAMCIYSNALTKLAVVKINNAHFFVDWKYLDRLDCVDVEYYD